MLTFSRKDARIIGSLKLSLEEIIDIMAQACAEGKIVARVHSGDPSIYGAIHEQMVALKARGIEFEIIPGVSSLFAAAAALKAELTVPDIAQTVIITRLEGKTPVPSLENLKSLAKHQTTMAIFLSTSLIERVVESLIAGGYKPETPAAVVYRASWKDEKIIQAPLNEIVRKVKEAGIKRQALILVGWFLNGEITGYRSKLYRGNFKSEFI